MPMNARLLRPRAAGGFDPRAIAGLEAWWDAADSASVTLDSGRVSEWRDKSGKNRHFANSTSGSTQPDYIAQGLNGKNLLRFAAASSQRLSVASSTGTFNFLHNGTPSLVLAVASFGGSSNPNALHVLFANHPANSGNIGQFFAYDDRTTSSRNNALFVATWVGSGSTAAITSTQSNVLTPQSTLIIESRLFESSSPASERLIVTVNGGSEIKPNSQTNAPSSSNATGDLFLGSSPSTPGFFLTGDVCELIFYSQIPTSSGRAAILRYLSAKWGIALA